MFEQSDKIHFNISVHSKSGIIVLEGSRADQPVLQRRHYTRALSTIELNSAVVGGGTLLVEILQNIQEELLKEPTNANP